MKKITSMRLDSKLLESLKKIAKKDRRTVSNLTETILFKFLEQEKKGDN